MSYLRGLPGPAAAAALLPLRTCNQLLTSVGRLKDVLNNTAPFDNVLEYMSLWLAVC